jgi:hypothetical protein
MRMPFPARVTSVVIPIVVAGLILGGAAPAVAASASTAVDAVAGPTVTQAVQTYQAKEGGRISVALTFSTAIDPASLPQGWYGSGTSFTKVFYSTKTVTVPFADLAGAAGSYTFTVDKTAPTVTGVQQVWQDKEGGRISVTLTFSEAIAPASLPQGWYGTGTSFTKAFYGSKTLDVSFADLVGNPGTTSLHVLTVPTGLNPAGVTNATGDPAHWNPVTGAATYQTRIAATSDALATATINGPFPCGAASGACTLAGYPIPEGAWSWQVRGVAADGTTGPWSPPVQLVIDRTAPTATITYSTTSPTTGNVYAYLVPSEPITIANWEARPDGSYRKAYPKNKVSPNWDQTVLFTDAAGNIGSAHVYIDWIDIVPPAVPTPLSPVGWTVAAKTFTWTASADENGPVTYDITFGDHPNVDADGRMTTDPQTVTGLSSPSYDRVLPTGPKFWQVRAVDALGNASAWSAPAGVSVIGVPAITSPTEHQVVGQTIVVTWTGVYGIGGVKSYQLKWNDPSGLAHIKTVGGDQLATSLDLGALDGNNTIRVRAQYVIPFTAGVPDTAWSDWSANVHVIRDAIDPVVTVNDPVDGSAITAKDDVPVTITATDDRGLRSLGAFLADPVTLERIGPMLGQTASGAQLGVSTTQTWAIPAGTPEGRYAIRADVQDAAGNEGTTITQVVVDRTRPIATVEAPDTVASGDGFAVKVTGSDAVALDRLAANLYDADNTTFLAAIGSTAADTAIGGSVAERTWTVPAGRAAGTYTIRVSASDTAGNIGVATARVTIEQPAAVPTAAGAGTTSTAPSAPAPAPAPVARQRTASAATGTSSTGEQLTTLALPVTADEAPANDAGAAAASGQASSTDAQPTAAVGHDAFAGWWGIAALMGFLLLALAIVLWRMRAAATARGR